MSAIDLGNIPIAVAQLLLLTGVIYGITKSHAVKIEQLLIDIAVIKSSLLTISKDHDNIIMLNTRVRSAENNITSAFNKLRSMEK